MKKDLLHEAFFVHLTKTAEEFINLISEAIGKGPKIDLHMTDLVCFGRVIACLHMKC